MQLTNEERIWMGLRLFDVRKQRKLSVPELAMLAGVSEGQVRHIEHGSCNSLTTLVGVVRALDVSLDYVVFGVTPSEKSWGLEFRSDDDLKSRIRKQAEQVRR